MFIDLLVRTCYQATSKLAEKELQRRIDALSARARRAAGPGVLVHRFLEEGQCTAFLITGSTYEHRSILGGECSYCRDGTLVLWFACFYVDVFISGKEPDRVNVPPAKFYQAQDAAARLRDHNITTLPKFVQTGG